MHAARRAIEPGLNVGGASRFLQMRDQLVILQGSEISVDLCDFEELAEEALKTGKRDRLEAALAIQQGSLLPEISMKTGQRPRVSGRMRKESSCCCGWPESAKRPTIGVPIEANRRLIVSNPCNEAAHRGLMRLYAAVGQRYLAVEQFRACTEVLRRNWRRIRNLRRSAFTIAFWRARVKRSQRLLPGPSAAEVPPQAPLPASPESATGSRGWP